MPSEPPKPEPHDAERRQVAVMMVDLVGSSRLARRLDPDDFHILTLAYREAAAGAISANGGYVARWLGDGILAYWGYPRAHEDDARRAIAGGLAAQQAIAAANATHGVAGVVLAARIGIAVGVVVVGRIAASGSEALDDILGDAPNMADRIQKKAAPGTVMVSAMMQRLAAAAFDFAPDGAIEFGADDAVGETPAVPLFRVLGARVGALRGRDPASTALHGRGPESAALAAAWRDAQAGRGSTRLLLGEAGIGKSSLLAGLRRAVLADGGIWLASGCLPETEAAPLVPLRQLLRGWLARTAPRTEAPSEPAEIRAQLLAVLDPEDDSAAYAEALLPLVSTSAMPATAPDQRRRLFDALTAWLRSLPGSAPAVITMEDMHWADRSSIDWLNGLGDAVQTMRLLLVCTARQAPADLHDSMATLTLSGLPRTAIAEIVATLDPDHQLDAARRQAIVDRAEGNPLFAEELTLLARESGAAELLTLPSSLNDSLLARLDELGPARRVAQAASVLGRDFDHTLLADVAELPNETLDDALGMLTAAGLLRAIDAPDATHAFKHALVRDTAYRSLLRGRRQALHRRAAFVLQARFPAVADSAPQAVALHLEEAEQPHEASSWWTKAGEQAARIAAAQEAVAAFKRAMRCLGQGSDTATEHRRAALLVRLGPQHMTLDGNGAASVERAFAGALAALDRGAVQDDALRFAALRGLHTHAMVRAAVPRALAIGKQLLRLATQTGSDEQLLQAHRVQGLAELLAAKHADAALHFQTTLEIYDPSRHGDHRFRFGSDPAALVLAHSAWSLAVTGQASPSDQKASAARAAASGWDHAHTMAHVLAVDALRQLTLRRDDAALAVASEALGIAQAHSFPYWLAWCEVMIAAARRTTDPGGAADALATAIANYEETGARQLLPYAQALRAECLLAAGEARRALVVLSEAAQSADETGVTLYAAEVLRLTGLTARKLGRGEPERHLADAQARAEVQGALTLALRVMLDRLAGPGSQALHAEAKALLASVETGGGTADTAAMRALLLAREAC